LRHPRFSYLFSRSHSHTLSHSLPLSLSLTHTLTLSHSLSHSRSHTLFFSVPLLRLCVECRSSLLSLLSFSLIISCTNIFHIVLCRSYAISRPKTKHISLHVAVLEPSDSEKYSESPKSHLVVSVAVQAGFPTQTPGEDSMVTPSHVVIEPLQGTAGAGSGKNESLFVPFRGTIEGSKFSGGTGQSSAQSTGTRTSLLCCVHSAYVFLFFVFMGCMCLCTVRVGFTVHICVRQNV
jgi:hypothetical protein